MNCISIWLHLFHMLGEYIEILKDTGITYSLFQKNCISIFAVVVLQTITRLLKISRSNQLVRCLGNMSWLFYGQLTFFCVCIGIIPMLLNLETADMIIQFYCTTPHKHTLVSVKTLQRPKLDILLEWLVCITIHKGSIYLILWSNSPTLNGQTIR